jgi:plasmid stability protein
MKPLWIKLREHRSNGFAIIDCSAIIDCMASITIRQLPETTKRKLRMRAAQNGRSMEQEVREILRIELNKSGETKRPPKTAKDLVESIRRRFAPLGGVNLEIPPRGPIRDPGIR